MDDYPSNCERRTSNESIQYPMSAHPPVEAPLPLSPAVRWRRRLLFFLRLVVSIGLMAAIILWYVPEDDRPLIITSLGGINLLWLGVSILFTMADRLTSAWKWLFLLRMREPSAPAGPVLKIFFISTFFGYLLPSSIGGDALRIVSYSRIRGDLAGSTSSVVIDRVYGTLALFLVSAIAIIPVFGTAIPAPEAMLFWAITVIAFVGAIVLSSRRVYTFVVTLFRLEGKAGLRGRLHKLLAAFSSFLHRKSQLFAIFFISVGVQILRVFIVLFLGMSLGLNLDPLVYFIYVPIITVITFLPFTIAGTGIREALFVYFFARPEVGVANALCISLSLLYFSMGIVATVPGLLVYLFSGLGKKSR